MKAIILSAGKGTRLRPLTAKKPKAMVEVNGKPILTHCFETLSNYEVDEFVVVVGYKSEKITEFYGSSFDSIPIQYVYQSEQKGLAHALQKAENHVDSHFFLMLGDIIFSANIEDAVKRQQETRVDATLLVDEVPYGEADRYGVCDTNRYGELTNVVEKPDNPPSNLVMTGFYIFPPSIFSACRRTQTSERGEYELTDAINRLLQSGHTVDAVPMDGWRIDVGYPEDRNRAEKRLRDQSRSESSLTQS